MYAHLPALHGSVKGGGVKLVVWAQTFLNKMMRSCKCFPHASKMSTLIVHPFVWHHSKLDTSVNCWIS